MLEEHAVDEQGMAPASVQDEAEGAVVIQTFMNAATGACLDDSREGLRALPCNGLDFQKWEVHNLGGHVRRLRNVATRACLDDSPRGLRAHPCNGEIYQTWIIDRNASGVRFTNAATGNCLDDSREGLRAFPCNDTLHQRWK